MNKKAIFASGRKFQKRLSVICRTSQIKNVIRAGQISKNVEVEVVSDPASENFIFVWFQDKTLYWYSDSEEIFLNEDYSYMFQNFRISDLNFIREFKIDHIRDVSNMFYACIKLTDISALSVWDTKEIQNISGLFSSCKRLENLFALKDWNMKNVNDLSCIFTGCSCLKKIQDLKNWDVSNVKDISSLFLSCESLESLKGLENWDLSSVKEKSQGFRLFLPQENSIYRISNSLNLSLHAKIQTLVKIFAFG